MNIKKLSLGAVLVTLLMTLLSLVSPTNSVKAETKKYVIATDITFAPFEYQDTNGEYVGIDIELMKSIAEAEGFEVEFKPLGLNAAVQALEAGQVDAVMAGMGITDERKQKFDFTDSYYDSGIGLGVSKNSDITSLSDLQVAVKLGTQSATYAESIKSKYGFTTTTFEDSSSMYQDVMVGNSDALFEDYPVLAYSIKTNNLSLKMTDHNENKTEYGVAVNKGDNAEFITAFNNGLKKLKESGKYDEIINKYTTNASENTEATSILGLIKTNWHTLATGLWNTIVLTVVALIFASLIGIIFGLMKTSQNNIVQAIAGFYIDIIRGVPLIVLTFFIYFGIPQAFNITMQPFVAGVITLSLNASAYIAEIIRGGIQAVDKGQYEACMSLGLPYSKSMQKVILPQAIRIMVPSFINQFVITLKDTSILSIIGIAELTQTGKVIIARNLQSSQMWLIVGVMYLIVIVLLTKLSAHLERNLK